MLRYQIGSHAKQFIFTVIILFVTIPKKMEFAAKRTVISKYDIAHCVDATKIKHIAWSFRHDICLLQYKGTHVHFHTLVDNIVDLSYYLFNIYIIHQSFTYPHVTFTIPVQAC